jgi:rSAM/selenodomain-associated transferase 1
MVDAPSAPVVAILTRAPSSGGKSRLFASLGRRPDPALLSALLLDTVDGAAAPGVRRVIAVTPPEACGEVRGLVADVDVLPQPEGDLGDRMRGVMAALFDAGAPAVAMIGSDLPHLAPAVIAEALALAASDRNALVLGPADDGGYYLIAASRLPAVFSDIEWGSARVLEQTEQAATRDGLHVRRLAPMSDVDTVDDLRRACGSGGAKRSAGWVSAQAIADGLK